MFKGTDGGWTLLIIHCKSQILGMSIFIIRCTVHYIYAIPTHIKPCKPLVLSLQCLFNFKLLLDKQRVKKSMLQDGVISITTFCIGARPDESKSLLYLVAPGGNP